jgi:hypothetical protein
MQKIVADQSIPKGLLFDNINWVSRAKVETSTHHDATQNAIVGNIIVFDAEVALPYQGYPVVSDTLFTQVMGPGVEKPTVEPRRVCQNGMESLKRKENPIPSSFPVEPDLSDFFPTPEMNENLKVVKKIHIAHAFINANPALEPLREKVPAIPAIYPLHNKKSTLYPVPLQNVDESKVESFPQYFKLTLKNHCKLESEWFAENLVCTFGDAFTCMRSRQASDMYREDLTPDPFDKFQFPEPFFGPFHLLVRPSSKFNLICRSLITQHFSLCIDGSSQGLVHRQRRLRTFQRPLDHLRHADQAREENVEARESRVL